MLARAFSRRESRYSWDTSSSSSELSAPCSDSDSDSEDEEREDVDEPEDDPEGRSGDSVRSGESEECNLPFPFCNPESSISSAANVRWDEATTNEDSDEATTDDKTICLLTPVR